MADSAADCGRRCPSRLGELLSDRYEYDYPPPPAELVGRWVSSDSGASAREFTLESNHVVTHPEREFDPARPEVTNAQAWVTRAAGPSAFLLCETTDAFVVYLSGYPNLPGNEARVSCARALVSGTGPARTLVLRGGRYHVAPPPATQ